MTTAPIATPGVDVAHEIELCSLTPQQREERLASIRREIGPRIVACREAPGLVVWEFEVAAATRERLNDLAELERECCGELEFEVRQDSETNRLEFEVRGERAAAFLAIAQGASTSEPASTGRRFEGWRFARALGFGTVGALLVCCIVPIAAVAVVGAAVAAPLLALDDPRAISSTAVAFGFGAWWFERSRAAARASAASDGESCGC